MNKVFWFYYQNYQCMSQINVHVLQQQEVSMLTVLRDTTEQILNSYHAIITVSRSAPSVIGHQISKTKKAAAC